MPKLEVLKESAGWYIGFRANDKPYRMSGHFPCPEQADALLKDILEEHVVHPV